MEAVRAQAPQSRAPAPALGGVGCRPNHSAGQGNCRAAVARRQGRLHRRTRTSRIRRPKERVRQRHSTAGRTCRRPRADRCRVPWPRRPRTLSAAGPRSASPWRRSRPPSLTRRQGLALFVCGLRLVHEGTAGAQDRLKFITEDRYEPTDLERREERQEEQGEHSQKRADGLTETEVGDIAGDSLGERDSQRQNGVNDVLRRNDGHHHTCPLLCVLPQVLVDEA